MRLYSFAGCSQFVSIVISESIQTIWEYVLKDCISLVGVKLPTIINTLPKCMFENCVSLKEYVISEHITQLGDDCFKNKIHYILCKINLIKMCSWKFVYFQHI